MELTGKAKKILAPSVVGIAAGVIVGVAVDRLTSEEDVAEMQPERKHGDWDGDRADYRVIVSTNGYSDGEVSVPMVAPAFEKPDLSEMVDYTKFSKNSDEDGPVKEPEGDVAEAENRPSYIEVISKEEFLHATGNGDGYISVVGTWFPEDRVLAGWNEELKSKSVEDTVGWDVMSAFDDGKTGAVYVRNTKLKVLYEIIRGSGTYEDSIAEG